MRLLKAASFALLGYVLYELFLGISEGNAKSAAPAQGGGQEKQRRGGQQLTGEGRGQTVETHDSDGGSIRHTVGRGVI